MNLSQPIIMGVLNVTPDSFSDGGKFFDSDLAIKQAKSMVENGAGIIDIGGESTRPGASAVTVNDELKRVIPVIEALTKEIHVPISIDTSKPEVMEQAISCGASIINDVNALRAPGALEMASKLKSDVCLMHMQGNPRTMQKNPIYADVVEDIKSFFKERIKACESAGIDLSSITLDPGFGFGKNLGHNIALLKNLSEFHEFGVSILAGLSRKSMIGELTGRSSTSDRLAGTLAIAALAHYEGIDLLRVHDVREHVDMLNVLDALA